MGASGGAGVGGVVSRRAQSALLNQRGLAGGGAVEAAHGLRRPLVDRLGAGRQLGPAEPADAGVPELHLLLVEGFMHGWTLAAAAPLRWRFVPIVDGS